MKKYLYLLATDQIQGVLAQILKIFLWLLSYVYWLGLKGIQLLNKAGLLKGSHLHKPVISIGNITLGGVGKTPLVIKIAEMFEARQKKPVVLIRGYMDANVSTASDEVMLTIQPGQHGSTYGGNLLGTRAAAFVLDQLVNRGLLDHVQKVGVHFERRLRTLVLQHPMITEVRGAGLMRGLQLSVDATSVIDAARTRGLLVNRTDEKVVRLLPPLTIESADIDRAVDLLDEVLAEVKPEVAV